jgi:hypothetical protein
MSKLDYYAIGRANTSNQHRYTAAEARKMLVKYKHYGPWELKTSTGL